MKNGEINTDIFEYNTKITSTLIYKGDPSGFWVPDVFVAPWQLSQDQRLFVSGSRDGFIKIWDAESDAWAVTAVGVLL